MIRAVIDVNVLLSAILGPLGFSRQIMLAWANSQFLPITSEQIISKLQEKLLLPRITRRFQVNTQTDIQWVEGLLHTQSQRVLVLAAEVLDVTGDPEDDAVLATGRLGAAEYLVTGDQGLLDLGTYAGMKIVTPRAFVQILSTTP